MRGAMIETNRTDEDGFVGPVALVLLIALGPLAMVTGEITLLFLIVLVVLGLAVDLLRRIKSNPAQTFYRLMDDIRILVRATLILSLLILISMLIGLAFYQSTFHVDYPIM